MIKMDNLDERIVEELYSQEGFLEYGILRKKIKDPDFVDRLCFLITIGEARVVGWKKEKTKYSEEVRKINRVNYQYKNKKINADLADILDKEPIMACKKKMDEIIKENLEKNSQSRYSF